MARFLLLLLLLFSSPLAAQDTFTVWHYETAALAASTDRALELFKAAHPGVKVAVVLKTFEEMQAMADRLLESDVPDVMEFNKGNANVGYYSTKGAFRNLSVEAERRGWDKRLPPSLQVTARYDSRGRMGGGSWYGLSAYGEFVLVYYNKSLFRDAGLAPPTTLAQLESALAVFKSRGVIPLSLSGAGVPAQHLLYELYLAGATRERVQDFQMYRAPFDVAREWRPAADTFAAWNAKGYFSPQAATLTDNAMRDEFAAGKSALMVGGTWLFPQLLASGTKVDWGTMLFPGNRLHPGSGGNLWVVPARSRHPDWAAEFMDLTLSPEVQTVLANGGGIAVAAPRSRVTNPRGAEIIRQFEQVLKDDALAYYPDWPALGFYDSLYAAGRDLLRGAPVPRVLEGLALAYRTKKGD